MKMDELINGFTGQLERAMEIGEKAKLSFGTTAIHNILITGLGGSGIGGTIVAELTANQIKVPVVVNKNYFIPAFVNENTLVIVSSYSGNTEETLSAMKEAFSKEAKIVCITSGGKVLEFAQCNGSDYIVIDGGMPPRACFGYSFTQLFYILSYFDLIKDDFKKHLKKSIQLLDEEKEDIHSKAKAIAEQIYDTMPIIYCDAAIEGVAIRFRQQLNENSKMLCWHHVIPEMNHNELVGWKSDYSNMTAIFLRNENDFERNQARMEISKKVAENCNAQILEIYSKGKSDIEKSLYLIHLTDWVSFYVSELRKVDPIEIEVIMKLKNHLSELPLN
jgi:glucose/mannose-6-phosphate isomerase